MRDKSGKVKETRGSPVLEAESTSQCPHRQCSHRVASLITQLSGQRFGFGCIFGSGFLRQGLTYVAQ